MTLVQKLEVQLKSYRTLSIAVTKFMKYNQRKAKANLDPRIAEQCNKIEYLPWLEHYYAHPTPQNGPEFVLAGIHGNL